jgi:hypothetical protein
MELLHAYRVGWGGLEVERSATALVHETGFAYMKRRETVPLKSIDSMTVSASAPSVIVKTVYQRELRISVGSVSERDKFYAALQGALAQLR